MLVSRFLYQPFSQNLSSVPDFFYQHCSQNLSVSARGVYQLCSQNLSVSTRGFTSSVVRSSVLVPVVCTSPVAEPQC
jgi:hypothetical protein